MSRLLILICALLVLHPAAAKANTGEKKESLSAIQAQIKAEEQKKKELQREKSKAEKQLKDTKTDLSSLTQSIRDNQRKMDESERRANELASQENEIKEKLQKDYGSMANTILALERMKRMPPELIVLRPDPPIQTARTASLLQRIIPSLNDHATFLREDLDKLKSIQSELAATQKLLQESASQLAAQKAEMDKQLAAREKEFKSANSAYRASASRAEALAAEAKTLGELLAKLQEEESKRPIPVRKPEPKHQKKAKAGKGGNALWPLQGQLVADFGDKDDLGGEIRGIKIKGNTGALVVTPQKGVVKYTGTFRNYGQLVIIEHSNGYHSLIAGMERTNVNIGQTVGGGEPVGYMTSSSSQNASLTLYYELRHDGEPVNPSLFLSGLKS